jgi:RNA polymerase sigma-70 factor (ECF subfamily)
MKRVIGGVTLIATARLSGIDEAEFAEVYRRTYWRSYRLATAILRDPDLAAEAAQEAYVRAYRARRTFRADGPVDAWLRQIVVRTAISHRRLAIVRRHVSLEAEFEVRAPEEDADPDLGAALDTLSRRGRAAVILRFYYGYDYASIGRILGVRQGTVGTLLSRSLRHMRVELSRQASERRRGK